MSSHHHHHQHRPNRLSLPPRTHPTTPTTPITPSRHYPPFTPTPTPSKSRRPLPFPFPTYKKPKPISPSSLLILLFSLRSLYSLLPFLQSSPSSFSIFPFSFLVSLSSFLLTLTFSLIKRSNSNPKSKSILTVHHSLTKSQHKFILYKSLVLSLIFLFRFQALRYCGTAALILAETAGSLFSNYRKNLDRIGGIGIGGHGIGGMGGMGGTDKIRGFFAVFLGLLLLSVSWDRIECFPFSFVNLGGLGFGNFASFVVANKEKCVRFWPMVLPFMAGFLSGYEQGRMNYGAVKELGRKEVGLISLFYTTVVLFVPAAVSMLVFEAEGDSVSFGNLGWPLANTVVFGVLLSENYADEKLIGYRDFRKEFVVTFVCTVVLELLYYPELSLWGLLICGMLLWVGVMELDPVRVNPMELGLESPDTFLTSVMKSVRLILSERKSRKIALFLLINTGYMVVEFVAGFMNNSLGLISDACHMLFDCAALAIGLYASYIARLPANGRYNYGRGRFEVLSGYVNAVFLVLVGVLIVLESLERILEPQEISTSSLLMVSVGGLAVNVVGLLFFHDEHHHAHGGGASCSHSHSDQHSHDHVGHDHKIDHKHQDHYGHDHVNHDHDHRHAHDHDHSHHDHDHCHDHDHDHSHHDHNHDHSHQDHDHGHSHHDHGHHHDEHEHHDKHVSVHHDHEHEEKHNHHQMDHNMEGIFLHVLADTLGSVGVVISTLLIQYKGWLIADPTCSIFISILIVSSVIPLLKNSAAILLQRVPRDHEHEVKSAVSSIMKIKGICGIQNFHIWSLANNDVVGTLHIYISAETDQLSTKEQVSDILHDAGIKDLTLQVEYVNS